MDKLDMNILITGPQLFQMIARKQALKLEILGGHSSKGSIYKVIKQEYGFEGNKDSVLIQLTNLIENKRVELNGK